MRLFSSVVALACVLLPNAPLAECAGEVLISCHTGNDMHLTVCIEAGGSQGGAFTYAFGPMNQPDLSLRERFSAGTAIPWSGVGRAIWEAVAFHNNGHVYEVWHSVDRLTEDPELEAGVTVLRDDVRLASLSCESQPDTVIAPVFSISDAMTDAGFCFNRTSREWRQGGCD